MVYVDIRGVSQVLCKFSLDLRMPVTACVHNMQVWYTVDHVFGWWHLATNRAAASIGVTNGDVGSGVADCDPQNIWNPRKTADLS